MQDITLTGSIFAHTWWVLSIMHIFHLCSWWRSHTHHWDPSRSVITGRTCAGESNSSLFMAVALRLWHKKADFTPVKFGYCQSLERVEDPGHRWRMMTHWTYSAGTSLAFVEQSLWPETLKWGLLWVRGWVRALAGAPESLTNFAAISQVWKLRCKNRSWNPVISVLLIAIPHARNSAEY